MAEDAETRLGLMFKRFERWDTIQLAGILSEAKSAVGKAIIKKIKELVHGCILEFLDIEGYPTEFICGFKEANSNDLEQENREDDAEERGDFERAELERGAPPSPPAIRIRFVYEDFGGFRQSLADLNWGECTVYEEAGIGTKFLA
ncbi:hypothetical protein EV426DRAFT_716932 [Tirmania nivea]|nr:hypothetical protein EV426DRAFT_716932 [Tirmania nivea]